MLKLSAFFICGSSLPSPRPADVAACAQIGESEPFICELLTALTATILDLESHQIHMFYEAVGLMISAESDPKKREAYLVRVPHSSRTDRGSLCYDVYCAPAQGISAQLRTVGDVWPAAGMLTCAAFVMTKVLVRVARPHGNRLALSMLRRAEQAYGAAAQHQGIRGVAKLHASTKPAWP